MRDSQFVKIAERAEELLHYTGSFALVQMLLVENVMEQFTACAVLKDKKADSLPLPHFVQLDDIRMVLQRSRIVILQVA